MSTAELKAQLFEGIENIDDNQFLLTLKELVDYKYEQGKIEISAEQHIRLNQSIAQADSGDVVDNEEVNKFIAQWLGA
jgi:hypothetical protein